MILVYWNWKSWLLFVLAAGLITAYFGILAPVQEALEDFARTAPIVRAANQPAVAEAFNGPDGRGDAYSVMFLFVFLSPLALAMAVTLGIFLLWALAGALSPVIGEEKIAVLVVEVVGAATIYLGRDAWLPNAMYVLGLLARAYVTITT